MGYLISSSSAASQAEGNPGGTAASFTFNLTRDAGDQATTNYSYTVFSVDGSGNPTGIATDFATNSAAFVWAAGPGATSVTITANPDTTVEPNESFQVYFYINGVAVSQFQSGVVSLTNDDVGPPVFSTAAAVSAAENGTAVSTVTAAGGGAVTYALTGGADQALFAIDGNTGVLTFLTAKNFEAPADVGANNVYDVQITATSAGLTTAQNLAVTVTNVNEAITNTTGAAFSVAENTTAITTATATDIDAGDTVTWSIGGGADAAAFQINAATGALSFVSGRNFEAPTDNGANNTYVVDLVATDSGGLTSTVTTTVTVANAAEGSVISSNGGGIFGFIHVSENTVAPVTTVVATDDDVGDVITYVLGGPDAALFTIDANTGVLSFVSPPNYEAPLAAGGGNFYQVDVTATSPGPDDTQTLFITVDNVIEPGVPSDVPGAGGGGGGVGPGLGTSGDDLLGGTFAADFRAGGDGNDTIDGGAGDDVIDGDNGDDVLLGSAGSDFIRGLANNDTVSGGDDADTVNGNQGDDIVDGGAGDDTVYGGQGNDTVDGGDGDDVYVNGNIGNDIVHGDAGADSVYGGQDNDTIYGDAGDDRMSGDLGNDIIFGGAGADRFAFARNGGQDWIGDFNGAEGDRVLLAPGTAFTISTYAGQVVIDLGGGDVIGLAGVAPAAFNSSWIVFG